MKNYTITVNGVAYEVTVEETTGGAAPAAMPSMVGQLSRRSHANTTTPPARSANESSRLFFTLASAAGTRMTA